jgi:exonuclease III
MSLSGVSNMPPNKEMKDKITKAEIFSTDVHSDHCPISVEVKV